MCPGSGADRRRGKAGGIVNGPGVNEAETRAEHIDPALKAAGWGVVEGSRIRREYPITLGCIEGYGRRGKALTAGYVLAYRNTMLAVIEAKAWDKPLTEGVGHAKNAAWGCKRNVAVRGLRRKSAALTSKCDGCGLEVEE